MIEEIQILPTKVRAMETLKLTRDDFRKSDSHWSDYIGKQNLSNFGGNLEIEEQLGQVVFSALRVKGSIIAPAGTGIRAVLGIEAGAGIQSAWGIDAGADIKAGGLIEAGWAISASEGIKAGKTLKAGTSIKAGTGIEAGEDIEAGAGIKAGWGVKAGGGIKAGEGIESGLAIRCKGVLNVRLRAFAGTCLWRLPTEEEKKVVCSRFEGGEIAYGTLHEGG
jgi:hypothetical protein